MDKQILAMVIDGGTKILSGVIRNKTTQREPVNIDETVRRFMEESDRRFLDLENRLTTGQSPTHQLQADMGLPAPQNFLENSISVTRALEPVEETFLPAEPEVEDGEASAVATGCIPCAMNHFSTCSGLLDESVRFARGEEGTASPEVVDRALMCLKELNAMERVDLRPEMIAQLEGWERDAATEVLEESRGLRHIIESGIRDARHLEEIAAQVEGITTKYGRMWMQNKIKEMSPEDKEEVAQRFMEKLRAAMDEENE